MDRQTKYLIIGNSIAAIRAAEALREIDPIGDCTIVTSQTRKIYSRPMLTHLVAGELPESGIGFRPDDFYERLNLTIMEGRTVIFIDPDAQCATIDDGSAITFEKALIATGSRAKRLNLDGADAQGVEFFHTLEDAQRILSTSPKDGRAVIVGAGLIGVRATYALRARGMHVTLVEMTDRIMPAILDKTGSDILVDALSADGSEVLLNSTIDRVLSESGQVAGVLTEKGERIDCSLLLICAGVEPNLNLIRGCGIETNRGILVDATLQTSRPHIYAAGDVVEFDDRLTGKKEIHANWPNAGIQGAFAGANMAGAHKVFDGSIGMNSIEVAGVPCITLGQVNPPPQGYLVLSHAAPENRLYKKLIFADGKLVGALLIGPIQQAGLLLWCINEQIDVNGIEKEILYEGKGWFNLVREMLREEMEGHVDWPESLSSQEFYEKRFNDEKWAEREEGKRSW